MIIGLPFPVEENGNRLFGLSAPTCDSVLGWGGRKRKAGRGRSEARMWRKTRKAETFPVAALRCLLQ